MWTCWEITILPIGFTTLLQNNYRDFPISPVAKNLFPPQRTGSVQLLSHAWLCDPMDCSMPHHQLLELTQTHVHWVSDAIQPSHPLLSPFLLPSIFTSFRVFSNESGLHIRWPKYWSFSFNISPSTENSGLISFRMVWLDLLAVQGILKSLPQHHSSKASILQCSAFFTGQISHPYMTTGKTIALARWTFVGNFSTFLICYLGWS